MQLAGKTAIVTGAGSGIGRAVALALAAEGAAVCVSDIDGERAERVAAEIEAGGGRAIAVRCDVSRTEEVESLVEETVKGLGRLDILVNNAGRASFGFVVDMPDEDWDSVFAVNMRGTFVCSRAALRQMIPQRSGRIINTASGLGVRGRAGGSAYAASKAAVINFTRSLAEEVARYGITVNAIAPGPTDTPFWRTGRTREQIEGELAAGRVGQPADLAPTVVFLCSDVASVLTGLMIDRQLFVARE